MDEKNEEYIRVAAYYMWKNEGCPEGADQAHWDKAKSELAKAMKNTCCKGEDKKECKSKPAETKKAAPAKKAAAPVKKAAAPAKKAAAKK